MHLGFIRALSQEIVARRTGILEVCTEDSKTRLYIDRGVVVYADQGTVGETLGRILLREKVINEASYERVLEAMARARHAGSSARFGEIVVELGILQPAQVDAALAAQVSRKVQSCLKWEDVTFSFTPKESFGELRKFPIDLEPLLLRAMRLIDHDQKLALLGQHDHSRIELATDAAKIVALLKLKTPEANFVRSIDGLRTTRELLAADVPDSVDPELLVCVLSLAGHARFVTPTDEERTKRISAPVPPPRRRREPEAPPSTKRGRRKSSLRSVVLRLTSSERRRIKNAALRLRSQGEARSASPMSVGRISVPTAEAARLVAEQHYRRGRKLMRQNRLADAGAAFKRAVDLEPSAVEYRLYAAWASFKELPEKESARASAVRAIAQRALKENPELGFAYYVLSHLAMRDGHAHEAEELLRRARALDPDGIEEEKPLRIAKGPPRLPPSAAAARPEASPAPTRTSERGPSVVALAPPLSSTKIPATKPAALPPSLPTPPALPARAAKPAAPKPPPPAIFAEPTAKVHAPVAAPADASADGPSAEAEPEWFARPAPVSERRDVGDRSIGAPPSSRNQSPSPTTKSRSIVLPAIGVGVLIGAVSGLIAFASNGASRVEPPPTASVTAPSLVTTAPSTTAATTAAGAASVANVASVASVTSATTPNASLTASPPPPVTSAAPATTGAAAVTGILVTPSWSQGRRVFVDGKALGQGGGELSAPCGARQVQIGSAGKPRSVDIPCGGKLVL